MALMAAGVEAEAVMENDFHAQGRGEIFNAVATTCQGADDAAGAKILAKTDGSRTTGAGRYPSSSPHGAQTCTDVRIGTLDSSPALAGIQPRARLPAGGRLARIGRERYHNEALESLLDTGAETFGTLIPLLRKGALSGRSIGTYAIWSMPTYEVFRASSARPGNA